MPFMLGSFTNGFFNAAEQTMQLGQMWNQWDTQLAQRQAAADRKAAMTLQGAQDSQPTGGTALKTSSPSTGTTASGATDAAGNSTNDPSVIPGNSTVGPVTQQALPPPGASASSGSLVDPMAVTPTDAEKSSGKHPAAAAVAGDKPNKSDSTTKKELTAAADAVKKTTPVDDPTSYWQAPTLPTLPSGPPVAAAAISKMSPLQYDGSPLPAPAAPAPAVAQAYPALPATTPPTSPAAATGGPVTGSQPPAGSPVSAQPSQPTFAYNPATGKIDAAGQPPTNPSAQGIQYNPATGTVGGPPRTPGQAPPTMAGGQPSTGGTFTQMVGGPDSPQAPKPYGTALGPASGTPVVNPDTGQNADVSTLTTAPTVGAAGTPVVNPDTGKNADVETMTGITKPGSALGGASASSAPASALSKVIGFFNPVQAAYGDTIAGATNDARRADAKLPPAKIDTDGDTPPVPAADQKDTKPIPAASPAVATTAPSAKVAPDQKGATDQSEATPTKVTPPVLLWPLASMEKIHPQEAKVFTQAAASEGVSPQRLAATAWVESGAHIDAPDGRAGEVGMMQVLPGTHDIVDPAHTLDLRNWQHNVQISAKYIKQCDDTYGQDSPWSIAAYNAGIGNPKTGTGIVAKAYNAQDWSMLPQKVRDYVEKYYATKNITPNMLYKQPDVDPTALHAAIQSGPDGALKYLATTAAQANAPLTDAWRKAEISGVYARLLVGDTAGAQQVQEDIMTMSRQGASMALMNADRALAGGDGATAAAQLARAHAFVPDGAMGRFGVDSKGQVWAQMFDDHDPTKALGPQFMVTRQNLQPQMIVTQDPVKYLAAVKEQQASNAQMAFLQQHGDYYKEMADTRRQAEIDRLKEAREKLAEDQQKAAAADATRLLTSKNTGALTMDPTKAGAVDKEAQSLFAPGSTYDNQPMTAQQLSDASLIYSSARHNSALGTMPPPTAYEIAAGAATGKYTPVPQKDGSAAIVDKARGRTLAYLPSNIAERVFGVPQPRKPPPAPAQPSVYASAAVPAYPGAPP